MSGKCKTLPVIKLCSELQNNEHWETAECIIDNRIYFNGESSLQVEIKTLTRKWPSVYCKIGEQIRGVFRTLPNIEDEALCKNT